MRNHFIVCITILLLGGCVSIELPGAKSKPAQNVAYTPPTTPFKDLKGAGFDKAWLSEKTGNTIAYTSDCGNGNDPSLQQIEAESLSSLNNLQTISSEEISFDGRAALSSTSSGTLDGVPVRLSLLVFKKNGCNYALSYGGTEKQFSSEISQFENFKRNFKAP